MEEMSALKKTLTESQQSVVDLNLKLKEKERGYAMVEDKLRNKEGFVKVQEVLLKSMKKELVCAEERVEKFDFDRKKYEIAIKENNDIIKDQNMQIQSLKVNCMTAQKDLEKKHTDLLLKKDDVYKLVHIT